MTVRFHIDADILGLAKLLVQVRDDVTYAGDPGTLLRPPNPITPATLVADWIPTVAANGWITITRDRHLLSRPAEVAAIRAHHARVVRLDARHQLRKWDQLEIVVSRWRSIEALVSEDGPWIYRASRSSLVKEL